VVAPTSDRPAPQVYAPNSGSAAVVPPNASPPTSPPGIPTSDVAVADSVRQLLKSDNSDLSRVANNVQASVDHGVVTLRGTVPADHVRDEIIMRVSKLPGVQHVHDELAVDFR
jgi:osmotically-inducible protein OsmY